MSADMLGVCIYYMAVGWHTWSGVHICRLTCLEHAYNYIAVSWHTCSGGAYMSADTLGVHIYYNGHQLAHACSRGAYMSADTLGAHIILSGLWLACLQ